MSASRFDNGGPPQDSLDLVNYYMIGESMGDVSSDCADPEMPGEEDIYAQLEQKERDLTLAAELGKALLEKNEELERRNEQIVDEFAQKMEELEQEKYELHLKLEKKETEYENTIKELQFDIGQLRQELHSHQHQSSTDVKERSMAIRELTLQNERLNEELRNASLREGELESENQTLKDQVISRRSSMHVHISQLEILQQEINQLLSKKHELEKRLSAVMEEKDALTCSLEESQERILVLEKSKSEKEQTIQNQERDVMELQETNLQLQAQLHHMSTNLVTSDHHSKTKSLSLFSEISQMSPHLSPVTTPDSASQFQTDAEAGSGSFSLADMMEDDYECDDDDYLPSPTTHHLNSSALSESQFLSHFQRSSCSFQEDEEFRQELVQVYTQLKEMCSNIRNRGMTSAESFYDSDAIKPGILSELLQELKGLMQDLLTFRPTIMAESQVCLEEENILSVSELHKHLTDLKKELRGAQGDLDRVKMELSQRDIQLEQKAAELSQLTSKLSMQHEALSAVQMERDRLHSTLLAQGHLTRDDIVDQARQDRDFAIEKQNKMELELAQSKYELMHLNGQLMEAIQQKVALSQELDQWQVDMEHLLDVQLRKRLKQELDKEEICEQLKTELHGMRKSKSAINFSSFRK